MFIRMSPLLERAQIFKQEPANESDVLCRVRREASTVWSIKFKGPTDMSRFMNWVKIARTLRRALQNVSCPWRSTKTQWTANSSNVWCSVGWEVNYFVLWAHHLSEQLTTMMCSAFYCAAYPLWRSRQTWRLTAESLMKVDCPLLLRPIPYRTTFAITTNAEQTKTECAPVMWFFTTTVKAIASKFDNSRLSGQQIEPQ